MTEWLELNSNWRKSKIVKMNYLNSIFWMLIFTMTFISCSTESSNSKKSIYTIQYDTCVWQAKTLILNHDTSRIELDHLFYRITDSTTAQWSYTNDTIRGEMVSKTCTHYTVFRDSLVFGLPCWNFPFAPIEPCESITKNKIATKWILVFHSVDNYNRYENSEVILEQTFLPIKFTKNIVESFEKNQDTTIVFKNTPLSHESN